MHRTTQDPGQRRHPVRRLAVGVMAIAAAIGTSATIGATTASAVPAPTTGASPTISLDLPSQLGNGGDLAAGSATIDNTDGGAVTTARVDFDITPTGDTAALSPNDIVVQYLNPADGQYDAIPLTADASGGGVSGFFGPPAGFPIAAGSTTTTPLKVTTNPSAPTGGIKVTASLDTTPGDTSTAISVATADIALATPTITFDGYPAKLPAGGDYATYTGTLDNSTGSNYGGAVPSNSPTPAGVRFDFDITSTKALSASDLSAQYCLGDTSTDCAGGTWTDLPLSDSNGHVVGEFGPHGGFALPNGAHNVTPFRVKALPGTPAGTVTTTVSLDKVDSSGSTTGTDSSGVANGTITSTTVNTQVTEPTLSLDLPNSIGNGGDLQAGSATIDNTGGPAMSGVRTDLEITPDSGTAALSPNDFVIKLRANDGSLVDVPLTADDAGGGLHGYAPPAAGFPIDADHSDTTQVMVGANPSAPIGGVTVSASLDTTPGDTATSIATASRHTSIATPTFDFPGFPTSITAGGGFKNFTASLHNATGSNYGGTNVNATPSPAGLVADLSFASNDTTLSTSQVLLQYCNNGSGSACTGGTWITLPLTGTGTVAATFGPTGGFVLPDNTTETTYFRIAINRTVPGSTTLTPTVSLVKVNPDGSASGTDSSGVANGTITTANPGPITIGAFSGPKITAHVTSAHAKTKYGWYRSPATVHFTCTAGTSPLRAPCPSAVTFRANGIHEVTRTITTTGGVQRSISVRVKIDHSKPHVKVSGVKKGHTYNARRRLHARCIDALSGLASCRIHQHRSGHTIHFTATAVDKAGNKTTARGKYHVRKRG